MAEEMLFPHEVDARMRWGGGTAERMARRNQLPHLLLPNGQIRFRWAEVASLVQHIQPTAESVRHATKS